ncbi:MAG: hypothetical protein Q9185_002004 [Variospora sp. 1 TL-2023]
MVEYIDLIDADDSAGPDTKPTSMANQANKAAPVAESPAKKVKLTNSETKISQSVKQHNPSGKNAIIAREEVDDFSSSLTSEMVNIYVGPKRKPYHIHRNRICSAAPFFSSHFGPLEGTKTPVTDLYLPNHDPRAFGMFLNFVYGAPMPTLTLTTTAPTQPTKKPTAATATAAAAEDQQHATNTDTFIHLYLMARTWSLPKLRNDTLDALQLYVHEHDINSFRPAQIAAIYAAEIQKNEDANSSSPLKRFVIDHFIYSVMNKSVSPTVRRSHVRNRIGIERGTFVLDVLDAMVVAGKKKKRWLCPPVKPGLVGGTCAYHEHGVGEECGGEAAGSLG